MACYRDALRKSTLGQTWALQGFSVGFSGGGILCGILWRWAFQGYSAEQFCEILTSGILWAGLLRRIAASRCNSHCDFLCFATLRETLESWGHQEQSAAAKALQTLHEPRSQVFHNGLKCLKLHLSAPRLVPVRSLQLRDPAPANHNHAPRHVLVTFDLKTPCAGVCHEGCRGKLQRPGSRLLLTHTHTLQAFQAYMVNCTARTAC